MAVCEYCSTTLLKDAESVKNIGKVAEVLEDYSPIQINTSGLFKGRNFTVVGRIQLRYEAGFWNEWHILFDDGASGWLSDASGQYILTVPEQMPQGAVPRFETLKPGHVYPYRGSTFFASDVRTAQCVTCQGELPFRVGGEWEAKVADFRAGTRFLTLDYSDGDSPQLYLGQAVQLQEMRCQLLRDLDAVSASSGKFKGKTVALDCPSCGSPIQYKAGMAFHVICPSCHAEVDCSTDKAEVLQKADEIAQITTTLSLGDIGNIDGSKFEAIGLLQCQAGDEEGSSTWVEYLLFNADRGFLWLVESELGWDRVAVLNQWPNQQQKNTVELNGEKFDRLEEYDSEVIYAAGAFNWRASIGDRTRITDFQKGKRKISSEANANEIVWTSSQRVTEEQIGLWFGKKIASTAMDGATENVLSKKIPIILSVLVALFNLPISFGSGMRGIKVIFWALVILWIPVMIIRYFNKQDR